jgi:type IV secretion system protein VirB6
MAGTFQIFEPAYTFMDGKLDQFLNADVSNVIAQVAGPMRAALVLYVILYGFAILRGSITEPILDFAIRSLKLAFIYMLATTVAYSDWVTQPLFHTLPDTLTQAISGSATPDVGTAFDSFFARAAYLADKIGKTATPVNLGPLLLSGAVYFVGALSAALGFGVVIIAKVTLALLVALGPIFIACALFDASRRFFFGWLSQAVNYILLMALIVTVFQLILSLVGEQWGSIDGMDPSSGGLLFIALSILGAIFFLQTPAIAAGIAGGASSGLADFGNAVGMAFRGKPSFSAPVTKGGQTQAPRTGGSLRPVGSRV